MNDPTAEWYRENSTTSRGPDFARGDRSFGTAPGERTTLLAPRLFAAPVRWGWQGAATVNPPPPVANPVDLGPKPVWTEPPHPDTSALHAARSKAVQKLIVRATLAVVAFLAFGVYQATVEAEVADLGGSDALAVYGYVLPAIGIILVLRVFPALGAIRRSSAAIHAFQQPYLAMRDAERKRHDAAVLAWDDAVRRHQADERAAQQAAERRRTGPLWYPVHPVSEPARVDVFGGDPHRRGWSCLLLLLGTSLLAHGRRTTVLDFTGQGVGAPLARIAGAQGRRVRQLRLGEDTGLDLLANLSTQDIAQSLAYALTERTEAAGGEREQREERTLAIDVLGRVLGCLDRPLTFARIACALRVLRRGGDVRLLAPHELARLVDGIEEIDQDDWTGRRLRFWAGQLEVLHRFAPGGSGTEVWSRDELTVLTTPGGQDDAKELIDRMLLQLARGALRVPGLLGSYLVVAGADRLGASTVHALSEQARAAGIRLVLFLDQPQGDIEKTAGTGGAVCIMKMYNHRDAGIAAEFIGKGYKFVVNQLTHQSGKTFSDGGGDSFAANTTAGSNTSRKRGRDQRGSSDSRGHAWTGNRTWSTADNIGFSSVLARVYEFITEPQSILNMAETEFILIDNSGGRRRMAMANCDPEIVLMDRVSAVPAPEVASS